MRTVFLAFVLFSSISSVAQDSVSVNKKRLNIIRYGALGVYSLSMVGLNELWYSQSPRESFHFFNDAAEWKQVDKVGHFYSAFQVSLISYKGIQWAGVSEKKSALAGALVSFGVMGSIEILDGFSSSYGASASDLGANVAGNLLFWGQMAAWNKIIVYPKLSFHKTPYASQNPDLLGKNLAEQIIKDYNGETFWLSVDMDKIMPFPKWLNLCIGYGAEGMVNANDHQNIDPYRQFYFGIDFDLTSVKTRSKFVNGLIFFANMVKIPAPTVEFSPKGGRFHILYF